MKTRIHSVLQKAWQFASVTFTRTLQLLSGLNVIQGTSGIQKQTIYKFAEI